jgi:osmotically-inducible protein OsmY
MHFAPRALRTGILLAATIGVLACSTPDERTDSERNADRTITKRVEAALHHDPYLDADHIDVQTVRGVVRLSGLVGTASDLRVALRISWSVPGVQRVVDDLEVMDFGRGKRG